MITGILLVQAIACAVLSAIVASNKNRSVAGWGALGFLFGVLGFIASIAVSEVEANDDGSSQRKSSGGRRRQNSVVREFDPDEHEKKCPMCAEYIKLEARRCKHCGHEFSQEQVKQQIEEVKKNLVEKRPSEPREKKDPEDLETPPPDKIAARCGDCHHPLREGQEKCPKCQKEVVWS